MRFDQTMIQAAQRHAYKTLSQPEEVLKGLPKEIAKNFKVANYNITSPAVLQQELPYTNTTNQYTFIFGTDAPVSALGVTPQLQNITLGMNDIFAMYGIQLLIGTQNVPPTGSVIGRIYNSRGVLASDYTLYNGQLSIKIESNIPVAQVQTLEFLEMGGTGQNYDMQQGSGLMLLNPQRILSGRVSIFNVIVTLNPLSGISAFSPNSVLSCRLHGALGQA